MIETHITQTLIEAQRRAHRERAETFASMFRAIPRAFSGLRHHR